MRACVFLLACASIPIGAARAEASKLAESTYTTKSFSAVTLLLNEKGQIGSNNPDGGAYGVLFHINDTDSMLQFTTDTRNIAKFIAVVDQSFISTNKSFFTNIKSDKLGGVLIYSVNGSSAPVSFSPGNQQPNKDEGRKLTSPSSKFNSNGGGYCASATNTPEACGANKDENGLHWIDLGVPMFLLTGTDAFEKLLPSNVGGWDEQNKCSWPCYGMSLSFAGQASIDTTACIRRQQCDPLGGHSILGSLRPYSPNDDVIMVAGTLDAVALFHDDSVGAVASASGLVSTLAFAKAIKGMSTTTNIMFTLFQGEQFGYIGSGAINDAISTGKFPSSSLAMSSLAKIHRYVEFGSFTPSETLPNFYSMNPIDDDESIASVLTKNITGNEEVVPSSLRGLFYEEPNSTRERLVVQEELMSPFYQSRYDDKDEYGALQTASKNLCKVVDIVATAVLAAATCSGDCTPVCNSLYVQDLLTMLLVNQSASMTSGWSLGNQQIPTTSPNAPDPETDTNPSTGNPFSQGPMNRYVSTTSGGSSPTKAVELLAYYELAESLGTETTQVKTTPCPDAGPSGWVFVRKYLNSTHINCLNTTVSSFAAISPAFTLSEGTWIYSFKPRYSSWTESVWGSTGNEAKAFYVADPAEESAVLAIGLVYFVAVFASAWYFNKHVYQSGQTADGAGLASTSNAMYAGPAPTSAAIYRS